MNSVLARLALGAAVLALAAAVVTTMGGAGLGGSLGSLFGYRASLAPPPERVAAVVPVATATATGPDVFARHNAPVRQRPTHPRRPQRTPKRTPPAASRPVTPAPAPVASPSPAPAVPPAHVPSPPPTQGGVEQLARAVNQVTAPVAPTQSVTDQVVQTAAQACALIGGCP
jgi:hypothetical protein